VGDLTRRFEKASEVTGSTPQVAKDNVGQTLLSAQIAYRNVRSTKFQKVEKITTDEHPFTRIVPVLGKL
jgi:hypothetical protein